MNSELLMLQAALSVALEGWTLPDIQEVAVFRAHADVACVEVRFASGVAFRHMYTRAELGDMIAPEAMLVEQITDMLEQAKREG